MIIEGKCILWPFRSLMDEDKIVTLQTTMGKFVLKSIDANSFNSPQLEKLVGKQIRCEGFLGSTSAIFHCNKVTVLGDEEEN